MFLVGLTGGIATGKSTVAQMLTDLGCVIIDADKLSREVVEPGKPAWKQIKKHFGSEVFNEDGTLDRDKLGQIIFSDESKRKLLNSITHPHIQRGMMWQVVSNALKGEQFVILDIPLLFETARLVPLCTYIIVVSCEQHTQLTRLMHRNHFTREQALQRINAQMPLADKCDRATHIIDNSRSREETSEQVRALCAELLASKKHWMNRFLCAACLSSAVLFGMVTYKLIMSSLS